MVNVSYCALRVGVLGLWGVVSYFVVRVQELSFFVS